MYAFDINAKEPTTTTTIANNFSNKKCFILDTDINTSHYSRAPCAKKGLWQHEYVQYVVL